MGRIWNPSAHPRDRRGRFTRSATKVLTPADRKRGRTAMENFKPKRFTDQQAMAYLKTNKPKPKAAQAGAVDRYTGDGFLDLNRRLRAGDTSDPEIGRLDAAMQPLPDDLLLTRHVPLEAFGSVPIEELAGMKVRDAAYASTALGTPYGGGLGGVTMHIAAPAGTPAVLSAALSRNPTEREVLLDRDLEMAIASVVPNNRGGHDMYMVVLPKKAAKVPAAKAAAPRAAKQAAAAATGREAMAAVPAGLGRNARGAPALSRVQRNALRDYQSSYFYAINGQLRRDEVSAQVGLRVGRIDEVMDASRLTSDVEVWRGVADATKLFGDRLDRDLTGLEWSERAYVSTSGDRRVATSFTYPGAGPAPVLMKVQVSKGTKAARISEFGHGANYQAEILLRRGLRMRVTRDHGVSPDGYRQIDVEVLP